MKNNNVIEENKNFIPFDIQLFAEDGDGENGDNGDNGGNDGAPKTFTQEEVLALIQSERDKRVSQAIKTLQKKTR
jgi:hypothetical protein